MFKTLDKIQDNYFKNRQFHDFKVIVIILPEIKCVLSVLTYFIKYSDLEFLNLDI